jgi:5-methylcytosine-specific restriction endonuclease McrA
VPDSGEVWTGTQQSALLARARQLLHDHQTRARKDGQALDYGLGDVVELLAASTTCRWCRMPVAFDLSLDHVQPIARGGKHCLTNLVAVCRRCQLLKGQLAGVEMEQLIQLLARLHPIARQDLERRLLAGGKRYGTRGLTVSSSLNSR